MRGEFSFKTDVMGSNAATLIEFIENDNEGMFLKITFTRRTDDLQGKNGIILKMMRAFQKG